jgi:hypothetical protein
VIPHDCVQPRGRRIARLIRTRRLRHAPS